MFERVFDLDEQEVSKSFRWNRGFVMEQIERKTFGIAVKTYKGG